MCAQRFEKLFEPIKICDLSIKNRIVMAPMETNLGSDDGFVTEQTIGYYEERAKGGVGLITVEGLCVDAPVGKFSPRMLCVDDDKYITRLNDLTKAIHQHGAKITVQIHHAGPRADFPITKVQPVGPSPIGTLGTVPRELSIYEIEEIIRRYVKAVQRAQKANFDALEIQFGGGYLLGSFLSAVTNKRQDEYGGELKNRAKIHLDILKAVREAVGRC